MDENKKVMAAMVRHIKSSSSDPFTHLLDEYLVKRTDRNSDRASLEVDLRPRYRPGRRLSPSSIGGCQRVAAFQYVGIRGAKKFSPRTELIFENGDWVHHKWQAIFQDMELVLNGKLRVLGIEERVEYKKLKIAGSLDARIELEMDGKTTMMVVDIKSINAFGFSQVAAKMEPKEEHVKQITTYSRAHPDRKKITHGAVLYENKNTQEILFLAFPIDKSVWYETVSWCKEVLASLDDKKIPKKHPECDNGQFGYGTCQYKSLCFGDMDRQQLLHHVYSDFNGTDAEWKSGLRDEQEENSRFDKQQNVERTAK